MNERFIGIVLKQSDYRENGALVTVLCREYGKLCLSAAGVRKMTSRNAAGILLYTKDEFQIDYNETRTMFRLKTAVPKALFRRMHENLTASSAAAVMAEAADMLSPEQDLLLCQRFYDLLENAFELLEAEHNPNAVLAAVLSDMLIAAGMGPEVDECVLCEKKNAAAISAADGGFLCLDCAKKQGIPAVSAEELHRFRLIVKAGMQNLDVIEPIAAAELKDVSILVDFLVLHAGVRMRSFSFYERVFRIETGH